MRIRLKIMMGFLVVSSLIALVGITDYISMNSLSDDFNHLNNFLRPESDAVKDMKLSVKVIETKMLEILIIKSEPPTDERQQDIEDNKIAIEQNRAAFEKAYDKYDDILRSMHEEAEVEELEFLVDVKEGWIGFTNVSEKFMAAIYAGDKNDISSAREDLEKAETRLLKVIDDAIAFEENEIEELSEKSKLTAESALSTSIILLSISIVVVILLSERFSATVTEPIKKLKLYVDQIGKGETQTDLTIKSGDEIEDFANAFNAMLKNIESNVKNLTENKAAMLNMLEDLNESNKNMAKTQKELKRSLKELKELDVDKDKFISIAAHELKTPMTAIKGFSQLLKSEKVFKNESLRKEYLNIVEKETVRLSKLVTDILDLSRADLGTMRFVVDEVDVAKLMEEMKLEMTERVKSKHLTLSFSVDSRLPKVETDSERLKEILVNLIDNAVKYTDKGGITVRALRDKSNVRFSVADTGIGIPKEAYPKMFTRFYQVASHLTRKVGGSGLGLSICKEIVEALGGKIWFESRLDKGSTFYFTVPITGGGSMRKEIKIM